MSVQGDGSSGIEKMMWLSTTLSTFLSRGPVDVDADKNILHWNIKGPLTGAGTLGL